MFINVKGHYLNPERIESIRAGYHYGGTTITMSSGQIINFPDGLHIIAAIILEQTRKS